MKRYISALVAFVLAGIYLLPATFFLIQAYHCSPTGHNYCIDIVVLFALPAGLLTELLFRDVSIWLGIASGILINTVFIFFLGLKFGHHIIKS